MDIAISLMRTMNKKVLKGVKAMEISLKKPAVIGFLFFFILGSGNMELWSANRTLKSSVPANVPLHFIPNQGQFHEQVEYCARSTGYTLWLTSKGLTIDSYPAQNSPDAIESKASVLTAVGHSRIKEDTGQIFRAFFVGANESKRLIPIDSTNHLVSFYGGNDRSEWKSGILTSKSVLYDSIYPKIDLKVYGSERRCTMEFVIEPGGNVSNIEFEYRGGGAVIMTGEGHQLPNGESYAFQLRQPLGFILSGKDMKPIEVNFERKGPDTVGFSTDVYNTDEVLVIQQDIAVSAADIAVGSHDMGYKITVDSSGGVYLTGRTKSVDFPIENSRQNRFSGEDDVFVAKFDATGSNLIYSTYLGGGKCDYGKGIFVDSESAVYVTGITNSDDFPTQNALCRQLSGGFDAFVVKLDPSGSNLVFSTYLGGGSDDSGQSLVTDPSGAVTLTGWTQSPDFPVLNAFDDRISGRRDVFVTKIHPSGRFLMFSTFLGGSSLDFGKDISLGNSGTIWITGYTGSYDFPVKDALFPVLAGRLDAFVSQIDLIASTLVFSTYLGGDSNDIGNAVAYDSNGAAYVTGYTSSENFPTRNALDPLLSGKVDAFVVKINTVDKSLMFSTFLGGESEDSGCDIEHDTEGSVYLTGYTYSEDFPSKNSQFGTLSGDRDAFVTKIDPDGSSILYSTFLGGDSNDFGRSIAVDRWGSAYVTGYTNSGDFPIRNAFHRFLSGKDDAFVTKLNADGTSLVYSTYMGGLNGHALYNVKFQIP